MSQDVYEELKINILEEMILNFDQIPVSFTATNKTTYTEKSKPSKYEFSRDISFYLPTLPIIGKIRDRDWVLEKGCISLRSS